jgi:hypothetical protein
MIRRPWRLGLGVLTLALAPALDPFLLVKKFWKVT